MNFNTKALVPATFALFAFAAFANGGDVSLPAAYPTEEVRASETSCEADAAFRRELAKSDGEVNPDAPACNESGK